MKKTISYETLVYFSYSNDKICNLPIRGIVLDFFGLGCQQMFNETQFGNELAEKGIILLIPYNNPWAWMNNQAILFTDEIVDIVIKKYGLASDIPIVSSGRSMGGLSALVYARYSKLTPVACVADCPVCDLPYHYTERSDLPKTLYSAFFFSEYDCIEDALKTASPLHLVNEMPDIAYYIFHSEEDLLVNKQKHSDKFVRQMQNDHTIIYHAVSGRGHCDLTDDMKKLYNDYIVNSIMNN